MDYLPVFMAVRRQPCLVVGGGEVAARKVELLRRAGAVVTVVAPRLGNALTELHTAGHIDYQARGFTPTDLDGCRLVVAATNDTAVNAEVSAQAQARALPVNVVDQPTLCSFIMPAIIERDPVLIAVSTGGAAPVLARLLRGRLETAVPAAFGRLALLAAEFREQVQARLSAPLRRPFWEKALTGPIAELVLAGREDAARRAMQAALAAGEPPATGEVYLVGGGPGDPDLLTLRALRLMQQADVVLYDRLVAPAVLDRVRRDAERIDVGKSGSRYTRSQIEINQLMIERAQRGQRVLRLKGGDPLLFGRSDDELTALAEAGIAVQIVPGISAANGCAAYAGIPLTHRELAPVCVLATAHRQDGVLRLDWSALARPGQTRVFYMGLETLPDLCAGLIAHGLPATLPAALVERGTLPEQRVHVATLGDLPAHVVAAGAQSPGLLIVGDVVALRRQYDNQ